MTDQLPPNSEPLNPTQMVIFQNGVWNFFDLSLLEFKEGQNGKYVNPNFQFGTVNDTETNPNKIIQTGKSNDYLFLDSTGLLIIMPADRGKFYV